MDTKTELHRGLGRRHIEMIAIGGCIGTGLFMGSGKTISLTGPRIILIYALTGFILHFVMRAMGELLLYNLNYKSFVDFSEDILEPAVGFFVGWSYWFACGFAVDNLCVCWHGNCGHHDGRIKKS